MDFVINLIIAVIATGLVSGVLAWGVSTLRAMWGLSPDAVESLEIWKSKIVDWVVEEAKDATADLELPETRWKWVNKAMDTWIEYIPLLMKSLGYSKKDLAKEVEREVRKLLREEVADPSEQ